MISLPFQRAVQQSRLQPLTFTIEPYDIELINDEEALVTLQLQTATLLRGLTGGPCRFLTLHRPTDLEPLISRTLEKARTAQDPHRRDLLLEYRRFYEHLQASASYQSAVCGLTVWAEEGANPHAIALTAAGSLRTPVIEGHLPPLLRGRYELCRQPFWHLAPQGRPGGRPYVCFLSSYEFRPVAWNFFQPLGNLFDLGFPLALAVDIPRTLDAHEARSRIEGVLIAYRTHLALASGKDSAGEKRYADCEAALHDLNRGEALHEVQVVVAVLADDINTLKERRDEVLGQLKPYLGIRHEPATNQLKAAGFFSETPTRQLGSVATPYPMVSSAAALTLGFLGKRKLAGLEGVLRGESVHGRYPLLHDSWKDRRAVHECWVGISGAGKTFALNTYLSREYAHHDIPFDLLEPMGHGSLVANALGVPTFVMDPQTTCFNPHDVLYGGMSEQIAHVIRLYETVLGRPLSGGQRANLERAGLAQALEHFYAGSGLPLGQISNDLVPLVEDLCDTLYTLGEHADTRRIYQDLASEIAGLCTGSGPFAYYLNGRTTVDFSALGKEKPRVFSFHHLKEDPILIALAYTQTLAALMRDAMADDTPRIIAVDEVYRMMRHPSLLHFLIIAAKTLRTRRKKLIVIDQQMRIFLEGEARLVFENCPIRVIFSQRGGLDVFYDDKAFEHLTDNHRAIIRGLSHFQFLFDVMDEGIWYLHNRPAVSELLRYGRT